MGAEFRRTLEQLSQLFGDSVVSVPTEIALLLLVLGLVIFMWDLFERQRKRLRRQSGLAEDAEMLYLKNSGYLPSKAYRSEKLGLESRPDALISEEGFIIPVDCRPTSKKVRDRHVAALLVHLRLIEEIEGKKPPYGILLMGPDARSVHIQNTEDKQRWLETLLDEMHSIMEGVPAQPKPEKYKCKNCDVRSACQFSAYREETKAELP